jgi:hypothetical protein
MQVILTQAVWLEESSTVEFYATDLTGVGMQVILIQAVWLVESSTVEFYGVGKIGDTVRAV